MVRAAVKQWRRAQSKSGESKLWDTIETDVEPKYLHLVESISELVEVAVELLMEIIWTPKGTGSN